MQADIIRKPVHVNEELRSLWSAERQLEREGIEPTPQALAEQLECSIERVMDLFDWRREPSSLDMPLDSGKRFDTGSTLMSLIADKLTVQVDDNLEHKETCGAILSYLEHLDERSADIIKSRFGLLDGRVQYLKEIGARHGIGTERTRQLEAQALSKLRSILELTDTG